MTSPKSKMLAHIVSMLDKLEVQYLIKDGDEKHSNIIEEEKPKRTRSPSKYKFGEVTKFIKGELERLTFNGVLSNAGFIDCKEYDIDVIRSNLSSYLIKTYGKNKFSTYTDHESNLVWYFPVEQQNPNLLTQGENHGRSTHL